MSKLAKIKKSSKEVQKKNMVKVAKKWQKILKVPERMTKNLSLHDIWHFVIFGILLQVDKLTSLTLWRVDMLTSYQEFRIIWFWAPKFETTTYSLTYLLTRVKSRDASASKNACNCWLESCIEVICMSKWPQKLTHLLCKTYQGTFNSNVSDIFEWHHLATVLACHRAVRTAGRSSPPSCCSHPSRCPRSPPCQRQQMAWLPG